MYHQEGARASRRHALMASPAKSQKHAPVPHDWLAPEAMVEVTMEDPGLVGSRYPARVLQVRAGKALVEFPAFDEDEQSEAKLKEWVACTLVAPPPPPPGADFVRRIKAGQPLDLWHEDGWWRVTVTGRRADGISVAAEDYGAVRTVDVSCLRPRWHFVGTEWQVDDTLRPLLREMLAPAAPRSPRSPRGRRSRRARSAGAQLARKGRGVLRAPADAERGAASRLVGRAARDGRGAQVQGLHQAGRAAVQLAQDGVAGGRRRAATAGARPCSAGAHKGELAPKGREEGGQGQGGQGRGQLRRGLGRGRRRRGSPAVRRQAQGPASSGQPARGRAG